MPLVRRTALTRKTRLSPISKTKKYRRRLRHPDFVAFVHWCDCMLKGVNGAGHCKGRIEADHAGHHPLGEKASDRTCIPACTRHHRHKTDYCGYYKNWGGVQMRMFLDEKIHFYQNLYDNLVALRQTPWRKKDRA